MLPGNLDLFDNHLHYCGTDPAIPAPATSGLEHQLTDVDKPSRGSTLDSSLYNSHNVPW